MIKIFSDLIHILVTTSSKMFLLIKWSRFVRLNFWCYLYLFCIVFIYSLNRSIINKQCCEFFCLSHRVSKLVIVSNLQNTKCFSSDLHQTGIHRFSKLVIVSNIQNTKCFSSDLHQTGIHRCRVFVTSWNFYNPYNVATCQVQTFNQRE